MMLNSAVVSAQYLGETNERYTHGGRYELVIAPGSNGSVVIKSKASGEGQITYESVVQFLNWWTGVETIFSDVFMRRETRQRVLSA